MSLVSKIGYGISKEIAKFAAPLTALASTGADGDGPLSHLQAVVEVPLQIFETGKAYATNEGIRDFTNGKLMDLVELIGNSYDNLTENPGMTLGIAAGVYGATRFAPHITKMVTDYISKSHAATE